MDDFTLGVLFVAERDDRGFAPTRVGTEFRVDVSLDNLGDGLGLFYESGEKSSRLVTRRFYFLIFLKISFRRKENQRKKDKTKSYPKQQEIKHYLSSENTNMGMGMREVDNASQNAYINRTNACSCVFSSFSMRFVRVFDSIVARVKTPIGKISRASIFNETFFFLHRTPTTLKRKAKSRQRSATIETRTWTLVALRPATDAIC